MKNKKTKRLLPLILLLVAALLLTACGKSSEQEKESTEAKVEEKVEKKTEKKSEEKTEEKIEQESEKKEEKTEKKEEEPAKETQDTTREFTDSTGRTVTIPAEITKIAVSGPLTQIYVLPLCPEMMVGFASEFSEEASIYIPQKYLDLPKLGQLYGGKGEMDLEALLAAAPDIVIDVGEAKKTIVEDMDSLTEQTGIPFVHIDATVATAPEAYRQLGELTGKTDKAEELAAWCEKTYLMITDMMAKVDTDGKRKTLLYCLGDSGTNVIAEGSFHAETINLMSTNLAVIDDVVPSGGGNEVDIEQIMNWDPEVIVFGPESIYGTVDSESSWSGVTAINTGNFYQTPSGPYGWLSSPPSVQRYLGLLWLGELLYPDYTEYDLQAEVTGYYELFYDCDLTDEMYDNLVEKALP
ncbi:MAG TPA: ABC transporter substrate-binding protein [Clostridiaceae bacterium]|jgi:iron complex transport system substrate-binding protein|nr:ABC transporter substrate-binding protein [Clostridiaceae bacterium]